MFIILWMAFALMFILIGIGFFCGKRMKIYLRKKFLKISFGKSLHI